MVDPRTVSPLPPPSGIAPGADGVAGLARSLGRMTRSSLVNDRITRDALVNMARTLLASNPELADEDDGFFLAEILADADRTAPGARVMPHPLPTEVARPLKAARRVSGEGVDVMYLSTHDLGHAVVHFVGGGYPHLPRELPGSEFSIQAHRRWRREFPRKYGLVHQGAQPTLMVDTMAWFRTGVQLSRPTVVISDGRMRTLPPNLLMQGERFAGDIVPMASAPSMAWLTHARATLKPARHGPLLWLRPSRKDSTLGRALVQVASSHGLTLDVSDMPGDIVNRELVVIAGFGAWDEARRVHVAERIGAAGAVIIFDAETRVAFGPGEPGGWRDTADHLLAQGVQAVISSPWPVTDQMPAVWLPAFIDAWKSGATVMGATFAANLAVRHKLGDDPSHALAMTVHGNPFLRRIA
ncbi:hypothetical protein FIV34_11780 [Luteibacter pinisoli]|uniref:CHAT domain-containing protein n=1 Tax=Luteibacter pinisoli TaxID=2589080 RepID=A0A4Y5Z3I0_9GAMM|nr:hypothetical protein [Luteibacter pinisoli]QDE39841.1 hypothetical protein FIV34_11780 [Luteibacter pinisoli]